MGTLNICFDLPLYHLHLNTAQEKQGNKSNPSGSDVQAAFGVMERLMYFKETCCSPFLLKPFCHESCLSTLAESCESCLSALADNCDS